LNMMQAELDAKAASMFEEYSKAHEQSMRGLCTGSIKAHLDCEPKPAGGVAHFRWRVAHFCECREFKILSFLIIFINAVLIGVQADWGETASNEVQPHWLVLEVVFMVIFVLELSLKVFGFGNTFFSDVWNILDFFIIIASVVDVTVTLGTDASGAEHLSTLRLVRVFRVVRAVNTFERLNLLVRSFLLALQDIVWVLGLLVMFIYMCAVLANGFYGDSKALEQSGFQVHAHFGTIGRSMATLFQMMTFDSWMSSVTRPVGNVHTSAFFFFVAFVGIAGLGILNLLTAIFVESLAEQTKEGAVQEKKLLLAKKKALLRLVQDFFQAFDVDNNGVLDKDEIEAALVSLENPSYVQKFYESGIDIHAIKSALTFADRTGDGLVDYGEFCDSISMLENDTKKSDTWEILTYVMRTERIVKTRMNRLEDRISALDSKVELQLSSIDSKLEQLLAACPKK